MKFYICRHCGNVVAYLHDSGVKVVCCGEAMQELLPNSTEASNEKHIPVIEVKGNQVVVKVGEVLHPMLDVHYIEWIALETKHGNQRVTLKPGDAPIATFSLVDNDEVVRAYAFCNIHGLWVKEA